MKKCTCNKSFLFFHKWGFHDIDCKLRCECGKIMVAGAELKWVCLNKECKLYLKQQEQ